MLHNQKGYLFVAATIFISLLSLPFPCCAQGSQEQKSIAPTLRDALKGATVSCFRCDGEGYWNCSRCRGKGRKYGSMICPNCDGTGYNHCFACNGTGKHIATKSSFRNAARKFGLDTPVSVDSVESSLAPIIATIRTSNEERERKRIQQEFDDLKTKQEDELRELMNKQQEILDEIRKIQSVKVK